MRPEHFAAVRSDAAAALPLAEFATFGFSVVAVVQGQCAAGCEPPALLGLGASGVSVPLVRGSDCPPVLGCCPGVSLTSSLEG